MESGNPKLIVQVRNAIRTKHYSIRTEDSYVDWILRFIRYHNTTHPREMGAAEQFQRVYSPQLAAGLTSGLSNNDF